MRTFVISAVRVSLDEGMEEETESSLLRRQLQMIVVQHLNAGKKVDSALDFSLNFTIAQERFSVISPEVAPEVFCSVIT